jgi:hypothetical protein
MKLRWVVSCAALLVLLLTFSPLAAAQGSSSVPASAPAASAATKPAKKRVPPGESAIESGSVSNGVYRNKSLALACKIPAGWVLRTDEMNARDVAAEGSQEKKEAGDKTTPPLADAASSAGAKVLLAAFSRPPEARAEDVNASIVIAAESVAAYPDLKEAAQYFFPLTEVAKARGFLADEEPYGIALDAKTLVRGDFHKNVGTRVMHQSTLVMLARGYAISITVIGGTDDEVEDLIDGLSFTAPGK